MQRNTKWANDVQLKDHSLIICWKLQNRVSLFIIKHCLHNPQFTLCNRQKTRRLSHHHRDDLCTKRVHTHVHRYGQISHQITTLSCLWEEAGAPRGNPRRIRGTDTRETPSPCAPVSPRNFFFFLEYCLFHLFCSSRWIVHILLLLKKIQISNESLRFTFLSQEFEILLFN